jgi:hypothetical protein
MLVIQKWRESSPDLGTGLAGPFMSQASCTPTGLSQSRTQTSAFSSLYSGNWSQIPQCLEYNDGEHHLIVDGRFLGASFTTLAKLTLQDILKKKPKIM